MELAAIIREEIQAKGPIPFSRWMELCLYHPVHGYYMKPGRKTGAGRDADFVTPPTLHPFFAACVAKEMATTWRLLGQPTRFKVYEWGGGEGDLAREALSWLDAHEPALARAVAWRHIERSPKHRVDQATRPDGRIGWMADADVETGWERGPARDHRPQDPAQFSVLCEVLDALPFDVFELRDGKVWRVCVRSTQDGFVEVLQPYDGFDILQTAAPNEVRALHGLPPIVVREGQRLVHFLEAMRLVERAWNATIGHVLVVDYMEPGPRLWGGQHPDGTVRGFRDHQLADVLQDPGDVDITATVDIDQASWKVRGGPAPPGEDERIETMEAFLLRNGILDALNAIDRSSLEGASSYLRLRQLLLPTGMGTSFKVQRIRRRTQTTTG